MPLPTKTDISRAVEQDSSIHCPQLQGFSCIPGIIGPESYSGGFCIVFPFVRGNEKKAVRVWHQEIGNIKQRYNLISADLRDSGLPYLSSVEFVENGLEVNGTMIDVMLMDWIEGKPLKEYLQTIIDSPINEPEKKKQIAELSENLLVMFKQLHKHRFSHGDLQHDNIIVTQKGEIKLIDYDCFYTPRLGRNFEQTTSGYKGYQHPSRFIGKIISNEKADYFSELILYTSIIAVSEDLTLWNEAKDSDFYFLFTDKNFSNLQQSAIFQRIRTLSTTIGDLLTILEQYLKADNINKLSPFEILLLENQVEFKADCTKAIRNKQEVKVFWSVPFKAKIELKLNGKNCAVDSLKQQDFSTILSSDVGKFELHITPDNKKVIIKRININVFDECSIDFKADKYYVFPSIPVKLTWTVKNAKKIWLDDVEVKSKGTKIVEQSRATTYVLKAEDEFGIKEQKIEIQMLPVPQVKTLLVPTPDITNNLSVTILQPRYNVEVRFPQIGIGFIKAEVPKVPSLTELGINVKLTSPLPKFSLKKAIKNLYNHIVN